MFWRSYNKAISGRWIVAIAALMTPLVSMADGITPSAGVEAGKAVYSQTCFACHGNNGKGAIPGVSDLTKADGPLSKPDEVLIKSIADGVATPGAVLTMPAKGGNPALTEADIAAVLEYLRATFGQ